MARGLCLLLIWAALILKVKSTCDVVDVETGRTLPCVFPFYITVHRGGPDIGHFAFNGCTNQLDLDNDPPRFWCSTNTSGPPYHEHVQGSYGYCLDSCERSDPNFEATAFNIDETVTTSTPTNRDLCKFLKCGTNAECHPRGRAVLCECLDGFTGDPYVGCHLDGLSSLNTLLVATGNPKKVSLKSELIPLDDATRSCSNSIPDFPIELRFATIGLLSHDGQKHVPLICGGLDLTAGERTDKCYFLNASSNRWILVDKRMSVRRSSLASIVIDIGKSMWITGGWNGTRDSKKTELVTISDDSVTFTMQPGPDLPLALDSHCLVELNTTTAMMIGGWNGRVLKSTYFMDLPTLTGSSARIVQGPDLKVARRLHSCGVLSNPGGGQVVIVAGGWNNGTAQRSTEMLDLDLNQGWTYGPDLPKGIDNADAVTSPDGKSLMIVGGWDDQAYSSDIFNLDFNNDNNAWQWTKLDQALNVAREEHVALLVPDLFCNQL